jgi:hypothetical protein
MEHQAASMLKAALALSKVVAESFRITLSNAKVASSLSQHAILLASASESYAKRHESAHGDLGPIVRREAQRVRLGSTGLSMLVESVSSSSMLADLALEAIAHAHRFVDSGIAPSGPSAALLLHALWEDGTTWADPALQLCAEFCSLVDLSEVAGGEVAEAIGCAGLPADTAHATRVCLVQNPRQTIADVRTAVRTSFGERRTF